MSERKQTGRQLSFLLALGLALVSFPREASCDNPAKKEALVHFNRAIRFRDEGDYAAAAEEYEKSLALYPTKSGLLSLGSIYKGLGRYPEAITVYNRLLANYGEKLDEEVRIEVETGLGVMAREVSFVAVEVSRDGAEVTADGKKVGTSPLDEPLIFFPGVHEVSAELEGYQTATRRMSVPAGKRYRASLNLEPQSSAASISPMRPLPEETGTTQQSREDTEDTPQHTQRMPADEDERRMPGLFWAGVALTGASVVTSVVLTGVNSSKYKDFEAAGKTEDSLKKEGEKIQIASGVMWALSGCLATATIITGVVASRSKNEEKEEYRAQGPSFMATPTSIGVWF
jgi:tetratricopeptide (TPR) repeat protein